MDDLFGFSLSSLPDMDGDGTSELLVGAPGYSYNKGIMYLLWGIQSGTNVINAGSLNSGFQILTDNPDGLFGTSVREVGDINGDKVADFIIGAPGSGSTGRAHVVFGANAWACDTCDSSATTCQTCKTGYNYKFNGACFNWLRTEYISKINSEIDRKINDSSKTN